MKIGGLHAGIPTSSTKCRKFLSAYRLEGMRQRKGWMGGYEWVGGEGLDRREGGRKIDLVDGGGFDELEGR